MKNSVCVIVGAGVGLGKSLARRFSEEGYTLALISRTEKGSAESLGAAKEASEHLPHNYFKGDATQPSDLEATIRKVESSLGPVDVIIYNARGEYQLRDPLDVTYDELLHIYELEVVGAFATAKAVLPAMIQRGHGSIFFSSATAAYRGSGTNPLYAIGKFGLRALSQSLAKAYGKKGIHVAHFRLDATLDVPEVREWMGENFVEEETSNTDDVAETYWWTHKQPRSSWSNEIELRPYTEEWTY
jgi:NAD(P)-dependent dehydrogenase (short-subunit alcohol dehydrogenase family)